jgi:hypothetical protein
VEEVGPAVEVGLVGVVEAGMVKEAGVEVSVGFAPSLPTILYPSCRKSIPQSALVPPPRECPVTISL